MAVTSMRNANDILIGDRADVNVSNIWLPLARASCFQLARREPRPQYVVARRLLTAALWLNGNAGPDKLADVRGQRGRVHPVPSLVDSKRGAAHARSVRTN